MFDGPVRPPRSRAKPVAPLTPVEWTLRAATPIDGQHATHLPPDRKARDPGRRQLGVCAPAAMTARASRAARDPRSSPAVRPFGTSAAFGGGRRRLRTSARRALLAVVGLFGWCAGSRPACWSTSLSSTTGEVRSPQPCGPQLLAADHPRRSSRYPRHDRLPGRLRARASPAGIAAGSER